MNDLERVGQLQRRISDLLAELREARDRIKQMEDALFEELDPRIALGMTRTETMLLAFLLKKGRASKAAIFQFLYSDRVDQPEPKIVDVLVCKIRRKLPQGVEIKTLWGEGFEIPEAGRRLLRKLQDPARRGVA